MFLTLSYFIITQASIIQYDTNIFTDWYNDPYNKSFVCKSNTHTQIITFQGTFLYIPKVFITQEKFDFDRNGNFDFSIISVTLTSFTMQLTCPTSYRVYSYQVLWWTIDSPHIEVINCFNIVNPTQSTKYTHTIPEAIYGFITFTSFQTTGDIDFTCLTNILKIGYQIILGTDNSFSNVVTKKIINDNISPVIELENNKLFFLNYIGFEQKVNDNIRLQKSYTSTATTIAYSIKNWCCSFIPNYITYVQIPYQYILVKNAFKANRIIIRTLEIIEDQQINIFSVKFFEISKQYTNIGSYSLIIAKTQQVLNINVDINCSQNQKITAKLNYCGQCFNQAPYELSRYCIGYHNKMRLLSRFASIASLDKRFKIVITSDSIQVTQLVQTETSVTWLNILQIIVSNN